MIPFENSHAFAIGLDEKDVLKSYRDRFHFPSFTKKPVRYFTGNSLGLMPKSAREKINLELDDWAKWGVEGHFHCTNPWFKYHEFLADASAKIVGALPKEVVVTHSLTTNLHLLLVSFYQPQGNRTKILCEGKAFPSDLYALESQVKFHGGRVERDLVCMFPREGEHVLRDEDVLDKIAELGNELALVMFGGVNYYTGQLLDMKTITEHGHHVGAKVGFDLAHAAGNTVLHLHDWGVDFAAWCSYKYLNSSPGGVSGMFVHERHSNNPNLPRFAGWWGYDKTTRFQMEPGFVPMEGAEGWQLSNAPVLGMAAHWASLSIFEEVGMETLNQKSKVMTGFLEFLLDDISERYAQKCRFEIITPREISRRGCQLSILIHGEGKALFNFITEEGIVADWREPNVIRVAPVPLYNSYEDVFFLAKAMEDFLK
jgi:kynureninase